MTHNESQSLNMRIDELQPNNWYINQAKLDNVRQAWRENRQAELPPVLVAEIDGDWSLIDGHSRPFAAYEQNATHIPAMIQNLEEIEGSTALYQHIHRRGPEIGIVHIADLAERILEPEEHARLWSGYCQQWLADNRE